jgi:hypothetical protein
LNLRPGGPNLAFKHVAATLEMLLAPKCVLYPIPASFINVPQSLSVIRALD